MTPTSDERREVAERLRKTLARHFRQMGDELDVRAEMEV